MYNQTSWGNASSRERLERAINTKDDQLFQVYIDRVVQFLTLRELGLQAILPKVQGSGDKVYVKQRSPNTNGGIWQQYSAAADEGVAPVVDDGSYGEDSFRYQTLSTAGQVNRKAIAVGRSYADVLALEMAGAAEDFSNALEAGFIGGCFSVDQDGASAAKSAPLGLLTLIENAGVNQCFSAGGEGAFASTGITSTWMAPLTTDVLDAAIDAVKGSSVRSDLAIIGSYAGIRQINAMLQAQQQFVNEVEIAAGFRVRSYDGIPLITSTAVSDTCTTNVDGAARGLVKARTGGAATNLYIINKRHVYQGILTPMTVMPLARTTSAYDKFDMFTDTTLVMANTFGAARINNISTTGVAAVNA
tara:strand:+ start:520 stop:1599 length:1080 start_codon:yes stop_codon:yes gene_type:complete